MLFSESFLYVGEGFMFTCGNDSVLLSYVMVNLNCQLDGALDHHGNKPLRMSVREFLDWVN